MQATEGIEKIEVDPQLVQPDYRVVQANPHSKTRAATKTEYAVNDPYFPDQWHYQNTGQIASGVKGADINVVEAWKKRMAANTVIVAVMDQGVDYSHEDLRANMWVNEVEANGQPGVDDDGNGLIDDIYGFDFGNGYGQIEKGNHGTHVAGTVAAVSNNGLGVAGVAGGDGSGNGARIMTLPVFGSNDTRVANCYIYAADNGALISQNSWGYNSPGMYSEAFAEGIKYFEKYAGCDNEGNQLPGTLMKGGAVIFASGNYDMDGAFFPSNMDEVIAVSALGPDNLPAPYTNYDKWVDVSSYGGNMDIKTEAGILSTLPGNTYGYMEGTSMACPHVSGMAALALAELGGPGFTNAMLRNYLMLTTRDNESNYTAKHRGKMGTGIVDAMRAMTKNDGVPPLKIADARIAVVSNEYVCVAFTASSKTDGTKVEGYRMTLTDLNTGEKKMFSFTETEEPGYAHQFTLAGLNGISEYKLTVVSYDVWGVESLPTDEMLFTTTQRKGQLTYSGMTTRRKTADFETEKEWEFEITISNNAKLDEEGGLYWRADGYNGNHGNEMPIRSASNSLMNDQITSEPFTLATNNYRSTSSTEKNVYEQAGYISYLTNRPTLSPDAFIGEVKENGIMKPTSAAQKFVVPESFEKGFLLTHFDLGSRTGQTWLYDNEVNAPTGLTLTFEIYRGGDFPKKENCIYRGTVLDQKDQALTVFALPYQPYFSAKETFWIVVHADKRYKYPLGVNKNGARPENSYYSNDGGKTWTTLSKVYAATDPVFTLAALSDHYGQESHLTLTPASGYLGKGESAKVKAKVNFDRITEGKDTTMVVFYSDGAIADNRQFLTSIVTLTRNDIELTFSEECYENGMVSLGDAVTKKVVVRNAGMGQMPVESITLSNPTDFRLITPKPALIVPGDSVELEIEFKPSTLGPKNTRLVIAGRGKEVTGLLIGTCVEAPVAQITPESLSLNVFGNVGQSASFTIRNNSNYSLRYEIPQFLKSETVAKSNSAQEKPSIERTDTTDLYGGYTWVDSHMGKAYKGSPWVEISETGIELTNLCDGVKKFHKVKLPFAFRYYDRVLRDIYVGIHGMLRCDTTNHTLNVPAELPSVSEDPETPEAFNGIISPFWIMDGTTGHYPNTRFYYQVFDNCVVFQFTGTIAWMSDQTPANYQVALYTDGSFEYRFKQVFGFEGTLANSFLVGWSSPDGKDGKSIHYFSRTLLNEFNDKESGEYCIKVNPPVFNPFSAEKTGKYQGVIAPMSSLEVPFAVNPKDLPVGVSTYSIQVNTNDPANKLVQVPVKFTKTDDLTVEFLNEKEHLGEIINIGAPIEREIGLYNTSKTDGKVLLTLSNNTNISFANNEQRMLVDLLPNRMKTVKLFVEGSVDALIYATDESGQVRFDTLSVSAEGLKYYNINASILDKKELVYTMEAGSSTSQIVKVTADDKSYQSKLFVPGFMKVKKVETKGKAKSKSKARANTQSELDVNGYRWMVSSDPGAPQFIWNDISKTGTRLEYDEEMNYDGHALPFTFPFYENRFDRLYISPNGRISPTLLGWDVMWEFVPPLRLPDNTVKVPLISAMWARQWYLSENKEAGIFYEIHEDKMIVQYHQFQYDWVVTNGFCSYQIILYKDGTIQFVYLDIDNCDLKDQITIGLQGKAESIEQGYTYTLTGSTAVKSRTTITAKPMYGPFTVEAGETIELELEVDNYGFKNGEYKDKVIFVSENNQLLDELPVTLHVSSNAQIGFREQEVDFGTTITGDEIKPRIFTLVNKGNEDLQINSFSFEGADADLFSVKKIVTYIEMGLIQERYEEITYPFSLNAFGTETFALFAEPKNETRACVASLVCESSSNTATLAVKLSSLKPALVSVESIVGNNSIDIDMSGKTALYAEEFRINYKEGVNAMDLDWEMKVAHDPLPIPAKAKATPRVNNYGPFEPVAIKTTPVPAAQVQAVKPMAMSSQAAEPFGSISVIGNTPPSVLMGTQSLGEHYGMSCFVRMSTGDHGFLMSHLRLWTNTIGRDTSSVTIRIYNDCPEPTREHLIYEKEHWLKMNVEVVGDLIVPLEKSLAFAPKQDFWVEVYYGVKLKMPMAVANLPTGVEDDRNYYRLYNAQTETWGDFKSYPAYFAIWAVQESYSDLTKWITPSIEKNSIAPSEIVNGKFGINPLHLPIGQMQLELTAKTNEYSHITPLRINAHKFTEPEWVEFPDKPVIVKEGDTVRFTVKAVDPDNLPITYRLQSAVEGVTLRPAADGSLEVEYAAPYTASHVSNLNIEARTEKGLSVRRISLANINVNRSPVAMNVKPITLNINAGPITLPTYYFFVDPDNEGLKYGASTSSGGVGLQLNENGFIFTPLYEDVVDVNLSATDGEFTVNCRFIINVVRPLNNPPLQIKKFTNIGMPTGTGVEYDLSDYFIDQDGDSLIFEAWAMDTTVAKASVTDHILNVVTTAPGITAIGIKVKDSNNAETLASFAIQAVGKIKEEEVPESSSVVVAPNPAYIESKITFKNIQETGDKQAEVFCEVRDPSGKMMTKLRMENEDTHTLSAVISVADFVPGVYFVSILQDNKVVSTEKLIVKE
ncbi:MAG: S8 family serine peptidase [Bacteroidales bacterium]